MDLFDSTKQLADNLLPRKHQVAASALLCMLGVLAVLPDSTAESKTITLKVTPSGLVEAERKPAARQAAPGSTSTLDHVTPSPAPEPPSSTPAPELTSSNAASPTPLAAVLPPVPQSLRSVESRFVTEVKPGDNLSLIFARAGLGAGEVYRVANSSEDAGILASLFPGYQLAFDIANEELRELELIKSPLESHLFILNTDKGYDYRKVLREPELRQTFKAATIRDSLFLSARRGGISAAMTLELASMFGGVVDFMLDVRQGDGFNVLYEEKYLDGEYIGEGAILAAQFTNQGRAYTALRYENSLGQVEYYNPEGESMRKAFLRNPVDFTRISDDFNLARRHPILNTIRAHKGTDYAAPNGTPVVATSDGTVTWAARNGSFGKLVVIKHGDRYESKYAHLSDYGRGVKKGTRVRQGQVIGYVGATGGATGPHLHYEFLMDGVHRNWRTVHDRLPKAVSIPAAEMAHFKAQSQTLLALLDSHNRQIAMTSDTDGDEQTTQ